MVEIKDTILALMEQKLSVMSDAQVDELIETFKIEGKNKRDVLLDEFRKQLMGWLEEGQDDKMITLHQQLVAGELSIGVLCEHFEAAKNNNRILEQQILNIQRRRNRIFIVLGSVIMLYSSFAYIFGDWNIFRAKDPGFTLEIKKKQKALSKAKKYLEMVEEHQEKYGFVRENGKIIFDGGSKEQNTTIETEYYNKYEKECYSGEDLLKQHIDEIIDFLPTTQIDDVDQSKITIALLGYFYDWHCYKKYYGDPDFDMYWNDIPRFDYLKYLSFFEKEQDNVMYIELSSIVFDYSLQLVTSKSPHK